ncbi:FAD-dependent oxidoreductase [Afipia birgiae]|uniref:FAD-dependent oxidoreductase n=2 Tax=Bacteria TaxID=2 RepID=UPI000688A970|nr:FAD-dependent oxidoreductase [Afipia birgiae]MBX9820919.1 FAD-dependent oxidoreductase [Afipia birgiae]
MSFESPSEPARRSLAVQCCIVGGGPAGMMLGYLLGRAGIKTVVLEKHADFFRDFRGDTVHPSTMQVMLELGLLDDFLKIPHQQLTQMQGMFGSTPVQIADLSRLNTACPFIALMPQWDFLNFLDTKGARFPGLQVLKSTEATELVRDGARITGVVAATPQGPLHISADLTVACDGRHSILREQAGLKIEDIGAPIDVLWFRVGKRKTDSDGIFARLHRGQMMVTIDRDDYWQCAYVIAKGRIDDIKAREIDAFRENVVSLVPILRDHIDDVKSWDDVKLLTVRIDRLTQWALPGLLCIGDAAHAMSPVGGVGVNLAVQDAVAAANILFDKFGAGGPSIEDLEGVQKRRLFPTRMTQTMQTVVQDRIINRALSGEDLKPPLAVRVINALPWLQGLTARLLGIGVRPEHVHSPEKT